MKQEKDKIQQITTKEPQISESDSLRLENLVLKKQLIDKQINELASQIYLTAGLKMDEYDLDIQNRKFIKKQTKSDA